MINHITKSIIMLSAACVSLPAMANTPLQLSSDVFVERMEKLPNGTNKAILNKPTTVLPGDSLIFIVKYKNASSEPASNLMVTNPLPAPVMFNGSADGQEDVSIDGGENWGKLNTLTFKESDGSIRPAELNDVTHVRWEIKETLAAGATGKLIFRGTVR